MPMTSSSGSSTRATHDASWMRCASGCRSLRCRCVLKVGLNIKAHGSSPCQTPRKHANAGKEHPRLGAGDRFLEIFGQASTAVEPSKRSFNHPASPFGLERADTL